MRKTGGLQPTSRLLVRAWRALIAATALYLLSGLVLWAMQDQLIYPRGGVDRRPLDAGLPAATAVTIRTYDGESLTAWRIPPVEGGAVFLYFPGHSRALADRAARFAAMTARGDGLYALSYRGFPGSTGTPDEEGLLRDADALWSHVQAQGVAPERIIIVGESLGGGPAIALGAKRKVAGVVLDSTFLSVRDEARRFAFWLPTSLLLRDQWRSDQRIAGLRAPLLQFHAQEDWKIPLAAARALFALAPEPKEWRIVPRKGHVVIDDVMPQVLDWARKRVAETR